MKPKLTKRFHSALTYASRLHAKQTRKGTETPYVSHLLSVTGIVMEFAEHEDEVIAALLHDAVEDQGGVRQLKSIQARFGSRVADLVRACSDSDAVDRSQKRPWRERKEQYLNALRAKADRAALLVSLADKVHNASAILRDYREHGEALWDRFNAGRDDQLWYYKSLVSAFGAKDVPPVLLAEFQRTVREIVRRARAPRPSGRRHQHAS